jgi:hypothetical protein
LTNALPLLDKSRYDERVRKEIWPRSNEKERGHRRKKMPMDAEWGHGRVAAAAHGCWWHAPRRGLGGITYYTIRAASHNLNEPLACKWRLSLTICRIDSAPDRAGHATRQVHLQLQLLEMKTQIPNEGSNAWKIELRKHFFIQYRKVDNPIMYHRDTWCIWPWGSPPARLHLVSS